MPPHCDSNVLHAPGECQYCDMYPEWQELRILMKVNFTGEDLPGREPCPSERMRALSTIEQWGGNRKSVPDAKVNEVVKRLPELDLE